MLFLYLTLQQDRCFLPEPEGVRAKRRHFKSRMGEEGRRGSLSFSSDSAQTLFLVTRWIVAALSGRLLPIILCGFPASSVYTAAQRSALAVFSSDCDLRLL